MDDAIPNWNGTVDEEILEALYSGAGPTEVRVCPNMVDTLTVVLTDGVVDDAIVVEDKLGLAV